MIADGVIVEEGAVIAPGVCIDQSTRIYNNLTDEISYGRVPKDSVVIAGTLPIGKGKCHASCAAVVRQLDAKTRASVRISELLKQI